MSHGFGPTCHGFPYDPLLSLCDNPWVLNHLNYLEITVKMLGTCGGSIEGGCSRGTHELGGMRGGSAGELQPMPARRAQDVGIRVSGPGLGPINPNTLKP